MFFDQELATKTGNNVCGERISGINLSNNKTHICQSADQTYRYWHEQPLVD